MFPTYKSWLVVLLALGAVGLNLAPPAALPAHGGQEDAVLFQEALSAYGQWLTYGEHGLVWRPRQVSRDWRPYTNGRWVPSQEGYVFETDEPWGWATYHYGNWLPTNSHGWVWVPGRTWYPHTVTWRTSDENVGWAPVPPPDNLSQDSFYSDGYDAYGRNSSGNYRSTLLPSYWIFIRAANFLLGWGLPYSMAYSYATAGVLLGPQYIPAIYGRTVYVTNYVATGYAANAWYNWGPPVTYITKVTNIKIVDIERRCQETRLTKLRNVMPPDHVTRRHQAWREILPMAETARRGHLRSAPNLKMASGKLNAPDAVPAPASLKQPPRPASPPAAAPPLTARDRSQPLIPRDSADLPSGPIQFDKKRQELVHNNPPAPSGISKGQKLPVSSSPPQAYESHRDFSGRAPRASQENRHKDYQQEHFPQDQHRAEQERLLRERRQQQSAARQLHEQQRDRGQQQLQMEQRRQAEMHRVQQMQQQQRQAEMMRQRQLAQEQQQQAEMRRGRQMEQQMIRQAPATPPAPQAAPPKHQQKREKQHQQ